MLITWKRFWSESQTWLKKAALVAAALAAFYIGALQSMQRANSVAEQKATGLAGDMQSFARQSSMARSLSASNSSAGLIGGSIQTASMAEPVASPSPASDSADRKLTRTASLDLVVQHPAEAAEQIRAIAERLGGYLETSQVSGDQDSPSASLTVRVPAARFEEARAAIRNLGVRVETERVDAQDVTKQYVDQDAQLRNLRAEETQYLGILKHASTVSDTLEVSEKLNEVRGQIEQQQAEFDALSKQIETVAITISLRAELETQVLGLHWRPLYQLKLAVRGGMDAVGSYASVMTSILFCLPAILLWMGTILIGLASAYRILRWSWRLLFARSTAVVNS